MGARGGIGEVGAVCGCELRLDGSHTQAQSSDKEGGSPK